MTRPGPVVEREFGVPIPGVVVAPERWARTALKKLPPPGPIAWDSIFGRRAPLIVDLGCGNGRFTLASAVGRPESDHVGIDILPLVLRYATRRANQRGLANVRFAAIDAQRFVRDYLGPLSVHEMHCYHPQPFHDRREAGRRLLTPAFLADVHQALEPDGRFIVQTDNAPYWRYVVSVAPAFFAWEQHPLPWPDAPRGRTRREIIALRRRLPVFRGVGVRRADIGHADYDRLIASLPAPTFDAGPRLRELDELEGSP